MFLLINSFTEHSPSRIRKASDAVATSTSAAKRKKASHAKTKLREYLEKNLSVLNQGIAPADRFFVISHRRVCECVSQCDILVTCLCVQITEIYICFDHNVCMFICVVMVLFSGVYGFCFCFLILFCIFF